MPTKRSTWKQERTTGRKYSGGDADQRPAPGDIAPMPKWMAGIDGLAPAK